MSLPSFSLQAALFSTAGLSTELFGPTDRYGLFAQKIYPLLAAARLKREALSCADNGRSAVEPVLVAGVSRWQFLEGVPEREAEELLRYHAGWNFALHRKVGDKGFPPTVRVYFRRRLIQADQSGLIFRQILEGLVEAGGGARQSQQRLDATQVFGLVSRRSGLDCVRESLRLAGRELEESAAGCGQPA